MRENAKGYFLERESMDWFTRLYCPEAAHRTDARLSPLLAKDLSGLPPAYIVTAGFFSMRSMVPKAREAIAAAAAAVHQGLTLE